MTHNNGKNLINPPSLAGLLLTVAALITGSAGHAQNTASDPVVTAPAPTINSLMQNPRNPLVMIQTSQGDIHIELFPEAAPQNVQRFLDLAEARLPVPETNRNTASEIHYYDGLTFHRAIRDTLIQAGAPERANRLRPLSTVADEINARGLGLEQQRLLDASGKPHPWLNIGGQDDFQQQVLKPLYRNMNINDADAVRVQQSTVLQRLQAMNLLQFHEMQGYRYDGSLPSRRPGRGSVMMVNRGPDTNDGEFFIALTNTPWLIGTSTVIGRVVSGLDIVERISRGPDASTRIYQVRQINNNIQPGD
ncbi:peptidylprolyl isomerase [Pseudohongiella sp.]|uniref:peptidylprolyl isomerase n=1 Tax=marine sediment metagenome TaxID=412755 RepID=A0A0F9YEY8_9ZZZZ|nr:peptidylprolyl isomerase [Pseudohongiella sp.]HDZ09982.1 peptidylprolyl isomerase [Pseudohongiella sp.]HEA62800.1 peptidylprolyl isomerase [Pseudohongiella sp.]